VSGNVSLYNETDGTAIPPTPVVGGVGLLEDISKSATLKGAKPGDLLVMVGGIGTHLGVTQYARSVLGLKAEALGTPPPVDLAVEKRNASFIRDIIGAGLATAVHDISDGGLACSVAEVALASNCGAVVNVSPELQGFPASHLHAALFGEDQARYIFTVSGDAENVLTQFAEARPDVPMLMLGSITDASEGLTFAVDVRKDQTFSVGLDALRSAYEDWLPGYMNTVD
jgi:phosphoribosylformylglycinamidine synthase subunit PurL